MHISIKAKLVIANLVVFGLLLAGLAVVVYDRTAHSEYATIDSRLEAAAAKIITEFEDEWEEELHPEWDNILSITVEGLEGLQMSLRSINDSLLFASDTLELPIPDVLTHVKTGEIVTTSLLTGGERYRRMVLPVVIDDQIEFVLTLMTSLAEVKARLDRLALLLMIAVAVTLLAASLALYFVTRRAIEPMSRMVTAAEQIRGDSLQKRIDVHSGGDEVGRLGSALNRMMDRIEAAFESQRQFVANASHELRTPLTVVVGELEYVQKQIQDQRLKADIDSALAELDRMSRLVDQLLTLARLDAGRLSPQRQIVRCDELLLECIKLLRDKAIQRNVGIDPVIEQVVECRADEILLRCVVLNLLENAIRHSPPGGRITARLSLFSESLVELRISDTGSGVAIEDRARIFDRFYRAAADRVGEPGSGLGLAIVKELVELHKGSVMLDEHYESGASFVIHLPVT